MDLRPLEPADLPALAALCARPEVAAELDAIPGEASLQSAPGVNLALGAFAAGALVGAAGMSALARPRVRHVGQAWVAAGPDAAGPLLAALRQVAAGWWNLDRLELELAGSTRLGGALAAAGFEPEVRRRGDRASPGGLEDGLGVAWVRGGAAAPASPRTFPRGPRGPLPPSFHLRPSRPADAPGFASVYSDPSVLWGTLQVPLTPVEVWRARLAAGLAAPRQRSVVAVVGDELVGTCNLHGAATPRRQHVFSLGMGVAAAWQGRGVGRAMMAHLVDLADGLGATRLELEVYADNDRAIALYERWGFVREGVKRRLAWREGALVDALVMARVR